MSLFSRTTESKAPVAQSVPQDILNAVNVMKSSPGTPEAGVTQSSIPSPFLSGEKKQEQRSMPAQGSFRNENEEILKQNGEVAQKSLVPITMDRKKILYLALAGVVVLAGGIGAWYFLRPSAEVVIPEETSQIMPVSAEPQIKAEVLPFVSDSPNYLSVDTETVTALSLATMLSEAGVKITEANMGGPVEFLLTDKNNNPIAFSRFVYLMSIEFPEELVASFEESFSLFVYNDAGQARLGLALAFVDSIKGQKLLVAKERSLPSLLQVVLFRESVVPRESIFRSGVYKDQAVRFVNIDATKNISFDYAFREKNWFIGTSKDALRAILDRQ